MKRSEHREHSAPIYMTSSFVFDSAEHGQALFADEIEGNIYSRFSNPNTTELINKMIILEGAEDGLTFASGMAAVFSGFAGLLSSGDHIIASRSLFGSSHQILTQILPKWGITSTYVDCNNPETWESEIKKNTKLFFVETPSNPGLDIVDLKYAGELCKQKNITLFVDNTFATPAIQKPMEFGADLIAHSTTKFIDGQGRTIGGVLVGRKELFKDIRFFARQTGPSMSPFNAWILSKSLETLQLRIEKHSSNASLLANELKLNNEILNVKYPFIESFEQYNLAKQQMSMGGGIVTVELKGSMQRAVRFINALELASITANLGDSRTIITHPATTTHSKLSEEERNKVGIGDGLIRIAVGLESAEDILNDITLAIEKSK